MNRFISIPFKGDVGIRGEQTVVSGYLRGPIRVVGIDVWLPAKTEMGVWVKCFLDNDGVAPASGEPSGLNVLEEFGNVSYLTGNAVQWSLKHETGWQKGGGFVKMYGIGKDGFEHQYFAVVTVELGGT